MIVADLNLDSPQGPIAPSSEEEAVSPEARQARAQVKVWIERVERAKRKWEPDFKRMRKNMEFVTGLQYANQALMDDDRYINNLTLRSVNQKVATLYAKNPTSSVKKRTRLDFKIWDGEVETLMESMQQAALIVEQGFPLPAELAALFQDVKDGKAWQKLIKRVSKTLQIVYEYQVDTQKPEFKEQMKQVVRRAIITGVGYVRPVFCREGQAGKISTVDFRSGDQERLGRAQALLQKIQEEGADESSPHLATLQSLVSSLGGVQPAQNDGRMPERLEFDFPPATSIIPDTQCRSLKDFVAARWIAQEYVLPVQEVNAIFGTNIKVGTGSEKAKETTQGEEAVFEGSFRAREGSDETNSHFVKLYEIWDYATKTQAYVCDGWPDYVRSPQAVSPSVAGFWHHFALTFNDTESEPGARASIFPPSDVQISKSVQKEWNRSREALREHRNANAPKYLARKGFLTDNDKTNLTEAKPNSVIELEGVPPEQPLEKFIVAMQFSGLDPALYDTGPLEKDLMMGTGMQQANLGAAQRNVTATVGNIAEQSRMTVSSSNIDDLDSLLSKVAQAGGEMLLQEMSAEVVTRIAGPGAVWPQTEEMKQQFLGEVLLEIEAASSGRPNKAIDVSNWRDLAPLIMQAGGNPVGVVQETAKRLDDAMDVTKFFPLIPSQIGPPPKQSGGNEPSGGQGPTEPASAPGDASPTPPALAGGN